MTLILLLVAVVAAAVAAGLGVQLARLKADERRRSEARVAALALAAGVAPRVEDFRPEDAFVDEEPAGFTPADPSGMFAVREQHSAWSTRLAIGGAVALAAIGLVVGATLASSGTAAEPGVTAAPAPPVATAPPAGAPLALRSLDHTMGRGSITISGTVENDAAAPAVGVSATAYLFARDGTFVASGRAPLDGSPLAPGAAARFTIEVPVSAAVARYRVSFRDATGRVVTHVDRRDHAALARNTDRGRP